MEKTFSDKAAQVLGLGFGLGNLFNMAYFTMFGELPKFVIDNFCPVHFQSLALKILYHILGLGATTALPYFHAGSSEWSYGCGSMSLFVNSVVSIPTILYNFYPDIFMPYSALSPTLGILFGALAIGQEHGRNLFQQLLHYANNIVSPNHSHNHIHND